MLAETRLRGDNGFVCVIIAKACFVHADQLPVKGLQLCGGKCVAARVEFDFSVAANCWRIAKRWRLH